MSLWDALERETQYAYDDLGRLELLNYPEPDADVRYTYTANQRKTMMDGLGLTTWTYDDLGRALAITDPFGNMVGYGYDGQGNRTRLTYADEKVVQYAYDNLNRLQTVTDWGNRVTGYTYDAAGRTQAVALPNGVTTTYAFDNSGRLSSLAHHRGTTLLANYQYSYDLTGNRLQAVEDVRQLVLSAGTGTPPGWTPPAQFAVEEAGYLAMTLAWPDAAIEEDGYTLERSTDGQHWIAVAELSANTLRYVDFGLARHTRYWYRLTAHNNQGSENPQTVQAETAAEPVSFGEEWVEGEVIQTVIDYQYDALYRLTQANYSDGAFFHYAYDSNGNRVSETTEVGTVESLYDAANRLTSVGASSYAWDANGNLTNDGVRTYNYNAANRLTGVTQNGHVVSYDYNGLGDRLVEGATQFEMDLNTGLTQALSDGANTYLYGNGRIRQFAGVDSAYFLGDALGSVRQLVDETGAVTLTRNYAPFGEVMDSTGKNQTKYSFTGDWTSSNLLV